MPTEPVIEVRGLRKRFGGTTALDGLDLAVRPGEVHGLLGPNGAGQTTTIRILLSLMRADGGTARLLGGDPRLGQRHRSRPGRRCRPPPARRGCPPA